jgi:hypothetical protein
VSQDFLKSVLGLSRPEPSTAPSPSREEILEAVSSAYERNDSLRSEQVNLAESYAGNLERLVKLLRDNPERILDETDALNTYPTVENLRQLAKEIYSARINLLPLELVLRAAGELPK